MYSMFMGTWPKNNTWACAHVGYSQNQHVLRIQGSQLLVFDGVLVLAYSTLQNHHTSPDFHFLAISMNWNWFLESGKPIHEIVA